MSHAYLNSQPHSVTALRPVLIPVSEDRRLSWRWWLVTYRGGLPVRRQHKNRTQRLRSAATASDPMTVYPAYRLYGCMLSFLCGQSDDVKLNPRRLLMQ